MAAVLQREIAGQPTDIVIQTFADRILVLVTQVGKVGNLVQVTLPSTNTLPADPIEHDTSGKDALPAPSPAIQLTPLLGSTSSDHHQTLQSLYASQIATIIWQSPSHNPFDGSRRSVVVGLALRKADNAGTGCELSEDERATFRGVMKMVQDVLREKQS